MKSLILVISLVLTLLIQSLAQELKTDHGTQIQKEDGNNLYKSDKITDLDLLQALEVLNVRINKFYIGKFDKKYNLCMMIDEYVDGEITKTDTVFSEDNQYHYYEKGKSGYYLDFIDQFKIFTKTDDDKFTLHFNSYKFTTKKEVKYSKNDKRQFFNWRNYIESEWKLNKKVPLMVFASSWEDKKYGFHRFCGVVHLSMNDEGTEELLSLSPNYFVVSYQVTEIL